MNVESGTSRLETIGATWHLEPLSSLRSGQIDSLALMDLRGLATFPSFHVCLALITAWALAPVPILGPLAVLLNAAVIVATIGAGGHYLPDVLAGGLLGGLALAYPSFRTALRARRWRSPSLRESEAASHSAAMIPVTVRARSITRPG
jgi:membrane-associated phospholipid phosphatase